MGRARLALSAAQDGNANGKRDRETGSEPYLTGEPALVLVRETARGSFLSVSLCVP